MCSGVGRLFSAAAKAVIGVGAGLRVRHDEGARFGALSVDEGSYPGPTPGQLQRESPRMLARMLRAGR